MAMPTTQILRLRRTDATDQYLLVNATRDGSRSLDLKLIGTEHEHLYHAKIRDLKVKQLQASNYSGNLDEWKAIMRHAFAQERSADDDSTASEVFSGLELVAAISGDTLTITLRKNIGGITQRLGAVQLERDDEREAVSPFAWLDVAVANADAAQTQMENLRADVAAQKSQVAKLNAELDQLVEAKLEHERELLSKFAALLNEKKLKIRDQQRLLNGAKIDPKTAQVVSAARSKTARTRTVGASGDKKRKLDGVESGEDSRDGDMGERGNGNDDATGEEEDDDDNGSDVHLPDETPPKSDDDATEDSGNDSNDSDRDVATRTRARASATSPVGLKSAERINSAEKMAVDAVDGLPPPRVLPFPKKSLASSGPPKQQLSHAATPKVASDDIHEDDDETDDEL